MTNGTSNGLMLAERRTWLKMAAAAGAATALGAVPAWAQAPKRGGHVRYGVRGGSTTDSLDPALWSNVFMRTMGYAYCNTLTEIAGDNSLQPELAESYEAKPGAKTWIFRIRSGVTFHNGKTMTVEDVIASIQHHRHENSKSSNKALLASIKEIVKENDRTIRFELQEGNADFPYLFADSRMMIMPAKDGVMDFTARVGTGGYVVKEFNPGVRVNLERNPNYWRSDRAFFASAEVIVNGCQEPLFSGFESAV